MSRPHISEYNSTLAYIEAINEYIDHLSEENASLSRYAKVLSDSMREFLKNLLELNPERKIADIQKIVKEQIAQQFQSEN